MLIKTGDAEIINIVDPKKVQDDDERKEALAGALEKAKSHISDKSSGNKKDSVN